MHVHGMTRTYPFANTLHAQTPGRPFPRQIRRSHQTAVATAMKPKLVAVLTLLAFTALTAAQQDERTTGLSVMNGCPALFSPTHQPAQALTTSMCRNYYVCPDRRYCCQTGSTCFRDGICRRQVAMRCKAGENLCG